MSIEPKDVPEKIETIGAIFMEIPQERMLHIDPTFDLLVLKIQEKVHYLCLVHVIPEESVSIFRTYHTKISDDHNGMWSTTLYGEIWDEEKTWYTQRYISRESIRIFTQKLLLHP